MNNAAIVAGLVGGDVVFFLHNEQTLVGKSAGAFESSGQPDDARADDE